MRQRSFFSGAALVFALGCATVVMGQSAWQPGHAGIGFGQAQGKPSVQMASSQDVAVKAGRRSQSEQELALRFVIQSGLHINSHAPHSHFLIPTALTFEQPRGIKVAKITYPPGVDYHFSFAPKDLVSVYTDQFSVLVRFDAQPGRYSLHGQLHYQACDDRACNPPRTLPITLNVTAR